MLTFQIKPKIDLPSVGKNLRDHLAVLITPFFINESVTLMLDRDISLQSFIDYHVHGKGEIYLNL